MATPSGWWARATPGDIAQMRGAGAASLPALAPRDASGVSLPPRQYRSPAQAGLFLCWFPDQERMYPDAARQRLVPNAAMRRLDRGGAARCLLPLMSPGRSGAGGLIVAVRRDACCRSCPPPAACGRSLLLDFPSAGIAPHRPTFIDRRM